MISHISKVCNNSTTWLTQMPFKAQSWTCNNKKTTFWMLDLTSKTLLTQWPSLLVSKLELKLLIKPWTLLNVELHLLVKPSNGLIKPPMKPLMLKESMEFLNSSEQNKLLSFNMLVNYLLILSQHLVLMLTISQKPSKMSTSWLKPLKLNLSILKTTSRCKANFQMENQSLQLVKTNLISGN